MGAVKSKKSKSSSAENSSFEAPLFRAEFPEDILKKVFAILPKAFIAEIEKSRGALASRYFRSLVSLIGNGEIMYTLPCFEMNQQKLAALMPDLPKPNKRERKKGAPRQFSVSVLGKRFSGKTSFVHAMEFPETNLSEDFDPTLELAELRCFDHFPFTFKLQDFFFGCEYMPSEVPLSSWLQLELMNSIKYNSCHAFYIVMYMVVRRDSFEEVYSTVQAIRCRNSKHCPPILILGNKIDLDVEHFKREVSTQEGLLLAQQLRCNFCEISVLSRTNLENVRRALAHMLVEFHLCEQTVAKHEEELKKVEEIDIARFINGIK